MTHRHPVRFALALLSLLAWGLAASADTPRWFTGSDKVYLRQHGQFVRVQEPSTHLARARRSYLKGHTSISADELEKAAVGFAYFADRSAGPSRQELELATRALEKLADEVRAKRVDEVTTLDRALADARRILAGEPPPSLPARSSGQE